MSASNPGPAMVLAQVRHLRSKAFKDRIIGLRSSLPYQGEERLEDEKECVEVVQCDSPLAMREAMRRELPENTTRVVVTALDETDLGDDIRLRLPKRKLVTIDTWEVVLQLFKAREVDPGLKRHGWLADKLVASKPAQGYQPAMAGFLGPETAWPQLLAECWDLRDARADLPALLLWSLNPEAAAGIRRSEPELVQAAIDWLTTTAGGPARCLVELLSRGGGVNALSMGLALGVLFHPEARGKLERAQARLEERYFARQLPRDEDLQKWALGALEASGNLRQADPRASQVVLEAADRLLEELEARQFLHLSQATPSGLARRLERLGMELSNRIREARWRDVPTLEPFDKAAREHRLFLDRPERAEQLRMALRLMRWLSDSHVRPAKGWASLAEAAAWQQREGGRVDWARRVLRAGETVDELAKAYTLLADAVARRQEELSRDFARLLVDWTASGGGSDDVMGVEQVLDRIVAPLASKVPVLVIVIDGMSAAVRAELLADLTRAEWEAICQQGRSSMPPCLAVIPSATEFSRTSLLTGKLQQGNASTELEGFRSHAGLVAASVGLRHPVLFHKASLHGAEGQGIDDGVRRAVEETGHRVVGVVLNAVDDHLLKGDQLNIRWERGQIRGLEILLNLAKASGRVVVLCSDHGHILDNQTEERAAEGGERWRLAKGEPMSDELVVSGARVLAGEGRLIAPVTETVRFGGKKNGYHGGLTPQEMVAPVAVLHRPESDLEGWIAVPAEVPAWWDDPLASEGPARQAMVSQGDLFLEEKPARPQKARQKARQEAPSWIDKLLVSDLYKAQLNMVRRNPPPNEQVAMILAALDERGGKMTQMALARAISYPEMRMAGLVASLQRLLNVDGYAVFDRDIESNTIELKRELLKRQFDIE